MKRSSAFGIVLLGGLLLPPFAPAQTRAVRAAAYVDADGKIQTGGVVLFDQGMIVQVGGDLPEDVPTDNYPRAVLSPGLIDCRSELSAYGNLSERAHAIQPQLNARDAFDRFSIQLDAALHAGVTTFALLPDDHNLIGGRVAICQTGGPDGKPYVLTDAGPLKLSLSPQAFKQDREPTSRAGAIGLLRETLNAARLQSSTDPLTAFANGQLPGLITVPSGADVLAVLGLAEEFGLRFVPIHTRDAHLVAEPAAGKVAGVIVGPLDLAAARRNARAAGLFERHGIPIALAGGLPTRSADSLRIGAAIATRAGLTSAAARRAITSVPAELLGLSDQLGTLRKDARADLVVFSGDPLDLRSRVLAVYIGGQRVHVNHRDPQGERP